MEMKRNILFARNPEDDNARNPEDDNEIISMTLSKKR